MTAQNRILSTCFENINLMSSRQKNETKTDTKLSSSLQRINDIRNTLSSIKNTLDSLLDSVQSYKLIKTPICGTNRW